MKWAIRRGTRIGLGLLLVAMAFPPVRVAASGTEQLVMLVSNIPGSSTVSGHIGWIDLISFAGRFAQYRAESRMPHRACRQL
jgi:hypothetical protein